MIYPNSRLEIIGKSAKNFTCKGNIINMSNPNNHHNHNHHSHHHHYQNQNQLNGGKKLIFSNRKLNERGTIFNSSNCSNNSTPINKNMTGSNNNHNNNKIGKNNNNSRLLISETVSINGGIVVTRTKGKSIDNRQINNNSPQKSIQVSSGSNNSTIIDCTTMVTSPLTSKSAITTGTIMASSSSPPPLSSSSPPSIPLTSQNNILPTNLSRFAGSKCFEAPSPTELPTPPQHWTMQIGARSAPRRSQNIVRPSFYSCESKKTFKDRNTHNLKLLLNVQS